MDVMVGGFVDVFWLTIVMSVGLLQKSLEQRFSNESKGADLILSPQKKKNRERKDKTKREQGSSFVSFRRLQNNRQLALSLIYCQRSQSQIQN